MLICQSMCFFIAGRSSALISPAVALPFLPQLVIPEHVDMLIILGSMDIGFSNSSIVLNERRNMKEQNKGLKKILNSDKNMLTNRQKRKLKKLMVLLLRC